MEYALDEPSGGSWLWGQSCYWIGGQRVGNYQIVNSLRDLSSELATIVKDAGKRNHDELFVLPAPTLLKLLTTALFGDGPENPTAIEQCWARFKVAPSYESFGCCRIYLVDHEDKARLVYANSDEEESGAVHEHYLRAGEFDSVVYRAFQQLDALYESAKGVESGESPPED